MSSSITASIANRTHSILIDTGASISAISQQLLSKLPKYCYRLIDSKKPTVFTASGEMMNIVETVSIDVNVNGLILPCVFHVTPTLSACTDIIFGVDLLQQFSCVIDLSCGTVSFYDGLITVGLQRRRVSSDLCATMPYDYVLPANTEIICR